MSPDAALSYKARKEAFVSHLSGSSLTEISLVTLVASAAILLWTSLQKRQSFFTPSTPISCLADFLLNVCAILFAFTLYSSTPLVLSIFLTAPALLLLLLTSAPSSRSSISASKSKQSKKPSRPGQDPSAHDVEASATPNLPVRPFLTHYRGSMLVATCIAILAVDFPIFPRRFAKVETWGTSLMDLGVGSFVFSAGVVSARALVKAQTQTQTQPGRTGTNTTFVTRFAQALRHSVPLLILGFVRLYSVKGLDYAEHVTEYGVHWNFFFTLALLPPFVEISDSVTRTIFRSHDILAIVLATTYELVLNNTDLLSYILISPRGPSLLSKNREGVFSFIGYLAIFLAGRGTGVRIIRFNEPVPQQAKSIAKPKSNPDSSNAIDLTRRERRLVLRTLVIRSALYSALFWLCTSLSTFNLTVSRRLANLPYVLWIVAFNNAQILLFGLVEACGPGFAYSPSSSTAASNSTPTSPPGTSNTPGDATSLVLRAYNANGLVVFLAANLLTGLVNLTVDTLDASAIQAMAVLLLYAALLTALALALDARGWKIKI